MSVHVFAGPTVSNDQVSAIIPQAIIHPPIRHGDLLRSKFTDVDTLVIVDGLYHHQAAVRHKEILYVMAQGAKVIGCSSIGALRAAELHSLGMIGNGAVFEMYRDGKIDADDEVALAHSEEADYTNSLNPLIVMRHAIEMAAAEGAVSLAESHRLIGLARTLHYTNRSWRNLEALSKEQAPELVPALRSVSEYLRARPAVANIKESDAIRTLADLPRLKREAPDKCPAIDCKDWRSRHLCNWIGSFRGRTIEGWQVSDAAILRYEQIYDSSFPIRWRSYAMMEICGAGGDNLICSEDFADRARSNAKRLGVTWKTLSTEQKQHWLLRSELATLDEAEAMLRVLVRSYRSSGGILGMIRTRGLIANPESSATAVAEAYAVNSEIASWAPDRQTHHISVEALRAHLAEIWGENDDDTLLTARARDRGFDDLDAAINAVRPLFLRHMAFQLASE